MDREANTTYNNILSALKEIKATVKKDEKPREVVKETPKVIVEDLGKNARVFFQELVKKVDKQTEDLQKDKSNWLTKLFTLFGGAVYGAYLIFTTKVLPAIKRIGDLLIKAGKGIATVAAGFMRMLKSVNFSKMFAALRAFVTNIITQIKNSRIGLIIRQAFLAIRGLFVSILERLKATRVGQAIIRVVTGLAGMFRRISDFIKAIKINNNVRAMFTTLSRAFAAVGRGIVSAVRFGSAIVTGAFKAFRSGFTLIGNAVKFIASKLGFLVAPFKAIGNLVSKLFLPLTALLGTIDVVVETFKSVGKEGANFTAVLKGVAGGLLKFFSFGYFDLDTINTAVENLSTFFGRVIVFFESLPEKLSQWFATLPERTVAAVKRVFDDFIGLFTVDNFKELGEFFKSLPGKILQNIKKVLYKIPGIGEYIKSDEIKQQEAEENARVYQAQRQAERRDAVRQLEYKKTEVKIIPVNTPLPPTLPDKSTTLLEQVSRHNETAIKVNEEAVDELQEQTALLKQATQLLAKMIDNMDKMGTNNVVINNTRNNRIIVDDSPTNSFRRGVTP